MQAQTNIALVPLDSDLNVVSVPHVYRVMEELVTGGCKRIILNMAGAHYIDSAGMALVFTEIRRMRQVGGLLSIINANERVLRSLRLARIVDFAPVSGVGVRPRVASLDASVSPLWRRVLRIDATNMASTRSRLEELLSRTALSRDGIFDLTLAVGEAMGNAVDHAHDQCALITVAAYADRAVIDVTDCGAGFDPSVDVAPAQGSARIERGRGIKLMCLLVDEVTITHKSSGQGMCVHLVKLVPTSPQSEAE